jgi:hypothetical protein
VCEASAWKRIGGARAVPTYRLQWPGLSSSARTLRAEEPREDLAAYLTAKLASAASTSSTSAGVCEALTWKRISSSPRGTTG